MVANRKGSLAEVCTRAPQIRSAMRARGIAYIVVAWSSAGQATCRGAKQANACLLYTSPSPRD
eukprot:4719163-Alexandrium_andersonii.AAC.1